jgi:diguanylate cyclase (GGDEF)-like protein
MVSRGDGGGLAAAQRRLADLECERRAILDRVRLLEALARSMALVVAARERAAVIDATLRTCRDALGFSRSVYFESRDNGWRPTAVLDAFPQAERALPPAPFAWCREFGRRRETRTVTLGRADALCAPLVDVRGWYVLAPIADEAHLFGFLCADGQSSREPREDEVELFALLGAATAAALRGAEHLDRARELASRDPLTGLFNRRAIAERLGTAVERCRRLGTGCAVAIFDLDELKRINDARGHREGDSALVSVASTLTAVARENDVVGRLAGDEFVVIFTDCNSDSARVLVRRASRELRERGLRCSIGAAIFPRDACDPDGLIAAADRALYFVKGGGKNGFAFS